MTLNELRFIHSLLCAIDNPVLGAEMRDRIDEAIIILNREIKKLEKKCQPI